MQIHGEVELINETEFINDKFKKRTFVLITDKGERPQYVPLECQNDKCALLDKVQPGDQISVDFNINGRKWNGPNGVKYFATLSVWKIERI